MVENTRKFGSCSFSLLFFLFLVVATNALAQVKQDSIKVLVSKVTDTLRQDTTKVVEDAALDIGQNRGLFIVTPDGKMQLRILGSVRYLVVYDDKDIRAKNSFSTYDIPVVEETESFPNLYNGLDQSRLGFEITRTTTKGGNLFVRFETDFAGPDGFRIRHAYGQYGRFLLGQTWSLFSQVVSIPATVDFNNPTGSAITRNPQIRYIIPNVFSKFELSLALEYSQPDLDLPDINAESFQVIPNVTARIHRDYDWGLMQVSGMLTVLAAKEDNGDRFSAIGWGAAYSNVVNSWMNGKWYFQISGGQGISNYYSDLSDRGLDVLVDPEDGTIVLPWAIGSFLTYEHSWRDDLFSNFTYGAIILDNPSFVQDDFFNWGDSFRINTFWTVVDGARVGVEFIHGVRHNNNGMKGSADRFNFLVYYDF